jgi:hypothetical protein
MDINTVTKTFAMLALACVVGGTSCATAAPVGAYWATGHHALARTHRLPRAHKPRLNPYAHGFQPYAYPFRPYPSAEERWFDRAKGNIWGD